ncbi:AAA family ATPase [bacterium]|nr:AAA family ATPase [bacterium]
MKIQSQAFIQPLSSPATPGPAPSAGAPLDLVQLGPLNLPGTHLVDPRHLGLKSLGGQPAARQGLNNFIQQIQENHKPWPILLAGNSGAGKTTLVRALAGDLAWSNVSTLGVEGADLKSPQDLQAYFAEASQLASQSPHGVSVLALEDLDLAARVRSSEAGEISARQHELLASLCQAMRNTPNVVVVATSSRPEIIDREATELFNRVDVQTPSGPEERLDILQSLCRRFNIQADPGSLEEMAEATGGDQISQLVGLLQKAAPTGSLTARSGRQARLDKVFGPAGPVTLDDANFRVTVCHELGHVVVRHLFTQLAERTAHPEHLPQAIDSVSFAPRGGANAAVFLKNSKNPISSFESYFAEVASNLAGRAAENQCGGGQLTAGPADDIRNATRLTQEAVRLKGMGQQLGPFNPNLALAGNSLRLAEEDEDRFTKAADSVAASIVNFYRPMIEDYAARIVAQRNNPEALCVGGQDLLDYIKGWEKDRPELVEKLQNWVGREMDSLKPKPPAIYDPLSDKMLSV